VICPLGKGEIFVIKRDMPSKVTKKWGKQNGKNHRTIISSARRPETAMAPLKNDEDVTSMRERSFYPLSNVG
jgi:hypothetical protein